MLFNIIFTNKAYISYKFVSFMWIQTTQLTNFFEAMLQYFTSIITCWNFISRGKKGVRWLFACWLCSNWLNFRCKSYNHLDYGLSVSHQPGKQYRLSNWSIRSIITRKLVFLRAAKYHYLGELTRNHLNGPKLGNQTKGNKLMFGAASATCMLGDRHQTKVLPPRCLTLYLLINTSPSVQNNTEGCKNNTFN